MRAVIILLVCTLSVSCGVPNNDTQSPALYNSSEKVSNSLSNISPLSQSSTDAKLACIKRVGEAYNDTAYRTKLASLDFTNCPQDLYAAVNQLLTTVQASDNAQQEASEHGKTRDQAMQDQADLVLRQLGGSSENVPMDEQPLNKWNKEQNRLYDRAIKLEKDAENSSSAADRALSFNGYVKPS